MKCSLFHLFDEVLKLTKNFQQGNPVGDEGNGIVNLYLCARCRATMYLACGTVEVNNVHFNGQVQ